MKPLLGAPLLGRLCKTRLERAARDKNSSLLLTMINYGSKKVLYQIPDTKPAVLSLQHLGPVS